MLLGRFFDAEGMQCQWLLVMDETSQYRCLVTMTQLVSPCLVTWVAACFSILGVSAQKIFSQDLGIQESSWLVALCMLSAMCKGTEEACGV